MGKLTHAKHLFETLGAGHVKARHGTYWMLDGLRGIAAIFVLLLHWFDGNGVHLFEYSKLAVDLFFLMSGFVIAHAYHNRLDAGLSFTSYFLARVVRLYPLFILGAGLGALRFSIIALSSAMPTLELQATIGRFTLQAMSIPLPGWTLDSQMFPLDSPAWSLFFEFIAYALYGLFLFRARNATLLLTILIGAMGTIGWLMVEYASGDPLSFWPGLFHLFFIAGIFRMLFSFVLGLWLWRHIDQFLWVSGRLFGWLAIALCLIFSAPEKLIPLPFVILTVGLLFPLTLISATKAIASPGQIAVCKWLGDISYPLYITHVPIIWTMSGILKIIWPSVPSPWWGLIVLPTAVALAYGGLRFYDEPVRAFLQRSLQQWRQHRTPVFKH